MKLDPQEQRLGYTWFVCAGAFALGLSLFLYSASNQLHASTAEADHLKSLQQLRSAQLSLPSGAADPRAHQGVAGSLRVVKTGE